MEAGELKQLMEAYDKKLDEKLNLNTTSLKNMNLDKTKKEIQSIFVYRTIEIVIFGLLALFIGSYIVDHWNTTHLVISGIIIHIFTLIALAGSIGQVVFLKQIDYSKPIVGIRKKIEFVNAHQLLFVKLMFLSAPIWWAYVVVASNQFLNIDLYTHMDADFVLKYLMLNSLLIIPLALFLNKLSYKNIHINWVRKTLQFFTGNKTIKALDFLNEIEEFES